MPCSLYRIRNGNCAEMLNRILIRTTFTINIKALKIAGRTCPVTKTSNLGKSYSFGLLTATDKSTDDFLVEEANSLKKVPRWSP